MSCKMITLALGLVLLSSTMGQDAIQLSATPSNVVNGSTDSLEVLCEAPSLDEKDNVLILMTMDRISRTEVGVGMMRVASLRGNNGPELHVQSGENGTTVEGQLKGGAFLKVVTANPGLEDAAKYTCRFAYLKMAEFRFVVLNETVNVTFTEPDQPTPPPVVADDGACSCEQVRDEVKELRETLLAENQKLKDQLKSYDDSCRVSFTARLSERSGTKFYSNTTMVFDSVLTNKGEAYDTKTGVFKAPCAGQYFFRLSMRSHQDGDAGYVDGSIQVNGVDQARTSVFTDSPRDHYEQASNGLVLTLKEGDEVLVRMRTNSRGKIYGEFFSIFAGFFIGA